MKKFLGVLFFASVLVGACKQEASQTAAKPEAMEEAKPAAPAAEQAQPAEEKKELAAAPMDSIGVAECDDYIAAMKSCLDKMPAAAREASESGFKQSVDAWKAAAATEAGKSGLVTACKAALDAVKSNPACQ